MFITLTNYTDGEEIYINPNYIKFIQTMRERDFGLSTLVTMDGGTFKVKETPVEIEDKIKAMLGRG